MLADSLCARGAHCVAVESSPHLPQAMRSRFDPSAFLNVIQHDTDLDSTLAKVAAYEPTHVMAGFESGVELAEQLGQRLMLPVNDPRLRDARRDKFRMIEAVAVAGLRTALQFRSNRVEELLDWIRDTLDWPVVLKPPKSVASDQVVCCHSADEVRQCAESILSCRNVLGDRNATVLAQQYLDGPEYAVDTVSCEGRKKTTAIWQYERSAESCPGVGYDAMRLLPLEGERQQTLRTYAYRVLDALGIRFGPAHCELMWAHGEPILVEVGARLSAGNNAILSRICGGTCQLDETVEAIIAPDQFLATLEDRPCLQRQAANVFLAPHQQGRLIRVHGLEKLQGLTTLYSLSIGAKPGDLIGRVAGLVTLVDEDPQAIDRDVGIIRDLEREGIFEVESSA